MQKLSAKLTKGGPHHTSGKGGPKWPLVRLP